MNGPDLPPQNKIPIFQLAIVFVSIIIILQMWLLTSSLDAYLGGETGIVLPAAVASGFCVVICWRLMKAVTDGNR